LRFEVHGVWGLLAPPTSSDQHSRKNTSGERTATHAPRHVSFLTQAEFPVKHFREPHYAD